MLSVLLFWTGDCKTSEVKAFTADYLEKVLEPCDWQAQWCTDVFDVLVEVSHFDLKDFPARDLSEGAVLSTLHEMNWNTCTLDAVV